MKTEVNGKIKDFREEFARYVEEDMVWKKANDQKWVDAKPGLDNMRDLTITGKTILKFVLFIISLGGAWAVIKKFIP